jgi:hypothetical protein
MGIGIACLRHRRSTRNPPHEQLLVRLGAGGASSSFVRCLYVRHSSIVCMSVIPPSFVCLSFLRRLYVCHSSIICTSVIPSSFVRLSFLHRLYVHRLYVHCMSIVCPLYVCPLYCPLYVRPSFVHCSYVRCSSIVLFIRHSLTFVRCRSTQDPPHEQWLVRLEVGGMSLCAVCPISAGGAWQVTRCIGCVPRGYPLQGSPGVPLRPLRPCRQPHIPFEWGGGGGFVYVGAHRW